MNESATTTTPNVELAENILTCDLVRPLSRRAMLVALERAKAAGRDRPTFEECREAAKSVRARIRPVCAGWGHLVCTHCGEPIDAAEPGSTDPADCAHLGEVGTDLETWALLTVFGLTTAPIEASYEVVRPRRASA